MAKSIAKMLLRKPQIVAVVSLVLALTYCGGNSAASAATLSWDPTLTTSGATGGSGNWDLNSTIAWFNGTVDALWTDSSPTGVDTASFFGTAGTVSVNSNLSALGVVFGVPGYTIANGGGTLTLGSGGIDGSALTAAGTTTIVAPVSLASNQTWNVGGPATSIVTLTGGVTSAAPINITKTGTGTLTLATAADTWSGTAFINAGTFTITSAQGAGTSYVVNNSGSIFNIGATTAQTNSISAVVNNGGTMNINSPGNGISALAAGSTVTLNPGGSLSIGNYVPTIPIVNVVGTTSTAATLLGAGSTNATTGGTANTMLADLAGNGGISMGMGNMNIVDTNMLRAYGGTMTWTHNETIRFSGGTTPENGPFATLNTSTFVVGLSNKTAAAGSTMFLGALSGGTGTTIGNYNVVDGSANTSTTYSGTFITSTAAVTKVGLGTWTLLPSVTYAVATNLNANGGILLANYANEATPTNMFTVASTLNFTGGTLDLKGKVGVTTAQTFGAVTVNANGAGNLVLDTSAGASTTVNVTLGAITATAAGGSLNFSSAGAGTTSVSTTSAPAANGTYGGRVTFTDGSGNTNWATSASAGPAFTLSGYSAYAPLPTVATTDTTNDLATGNVSLTGAVTTNSLKATTTGAGQSLNLGGNALTLTNGGLLFTGANDYSISNGTLVSGLATNPDLVVQHFGAGKLTIGATIIDGTTAATAFTKAGSGTLILTGSNTYTGTSNLTGGVTSISADQNLGGGNGTINVTSTATSTSVTFTGTTLPAGFGVGSSLLGATVTAISGTTNGATITLNGNGATSTLTTQDASWANTPNINLNGATLSASTSLSLQESNSGGAAGTSVANRNIVLYGGGGFLDVPGSNNLTIPGVISSINTSNLGPLVKVNTGTATVGGGPAVNFNATLNATSTDVTVDNSVGLVIGQTITGAGIPANATITAINSPTDITISAAATLTATSPAAAYVSNTYGAATIIRAGTLSTAILTNGGISSGIGSSPSAAPALVFDGGLLRYTGAGGVTGTTDRTFTLTTNGGGLDATGNTGPLVFSNVAPIVADSTLAGSGARTFTLKGNTSGNVFAGLIGDGTGGATSLSVTGTAGWTLTNSHTYTGTTSVSGGSTLTLAPTAASTNPIASSSKISVGAGSFLNVAGLTSGTIALTNTQTLGGAGTVTGSVLTASPAGTNPGSHVAPGDVGISNGVGTLHVTGTFNMATGSSYDYDFANTGGVPSGNDQVAVAGSLLTVNGGVFNLFSAGTANRYSSDATGLTLFTYAGADTLGGAINSILSIGNPVAGLSYTFHDTGHAITLDISGTPVVIGNWITDGSSGWDAAVNWDSNPSIPNTSGATAIFGGSAATHNNLNRTISLNGDKTVGTLTISNPNGESYTIAPGVPAGHLIFDNGALAANITSAGTQAITAGVVLNSLANFTVSGSTDTLNLSGAIQGSKTITKAGAGVLVLGSGNTYGPAAGTVGTTLTAGTLQVGNSTALSTGDLAVTGNSTLQAGVAGLAIGNNVVVTTGATATIDTQANTVTMSGVISQTAGAGNGAVTKQGSGTLKVTGNSTYAGNTTIGAGTLQLGDGTATGSVAGNIVNNGALVLNHSDLTFAVNNTISGTGSLSLVGAAATLNGANTFSGDTVLSAGTMTLGNSLALQNSTLNYDNQGGVINFGTLTAASLGGLKGGEDLSLLNASSAALVLTVGNNNQSTTYAGVLSGAGAGLTKAGNGTLNLTNNSSISGALTISNGGLQLTTGQLNQVGAVTINSGFITVNGGSLISSAASAMNNNNGNNVTLNVSAGSVAFNGGDTTTTAALSAQANASANNFLINVTGGTLTANSLTMGRGGFAPTAQPTAGDTGTGLYINGGSVNIAGFLAMSTNASTNSGVSARIDSGNLTVGGPITVGLSSTANRWSVIDVNGGTFNSTDPTTGVQLGFGAAGNGELLIRAGTATVQKVTFGQTAADAAETGAVDVTSNKDTNGNITTSGTLYVGAGGMSRGFVGGTTFVPQVQLGDGGLIGAAASFSSDASWILNGTTTGGTLQAADALNNPHDITISGPVSGAAPWTKTGGGTLILTGTNSYSAITINAGNLAGNTDGLQSTINTTVATQNVTFNQGTVVNGGGFNGNINGPGNVVKTGTGTVLFNGGSSYTGTTTLTQGSFNLQGSNVLTSSSEFIFNGGTLNTNGSDQIMTSTVLHLAANSKLDYGSGRGPTPNPDTVQFSLTTAADSWTSGALLRISDWTSSTPFSGGGPDKLLAGVGGLSASQLSHIHFTGYLTGSTIISSGVNAGEVVPITGTALKLGDVNQDGAVSVADISAMMAALSDVADYENGSLKYPGTSTFVRANHTIPFDSLDYTDVADASLDGVVDNTDIQAEITAIANGGVFGGGSGSGGGSITAVPEPASLVLLGIALPALGLAWRRRRVS